MIKLAPKLICTALVLSILLTFTGCCCCIPNGDFLEQLAGSSKAGTYYLTEVTSMGMTFDKDEIESVLGLDPDECYVRLNSDNTGVLSFGGNTADICWDDSQIWPDHDPSETMNYTLSGDEITFSQYGVTLIFKK